MPRLVGIALALMVATACAGAGQTVPGDPPHTCPPFLGGIVDDPAVQPPNGATGVSPTIGSITVPSIPALLGATVLLNPPVGSGPSSGGVFVAAGPSMLSATLPTLAAHTTYFPQALVLVSAGTGPLGCDVYRSYTLGSFTTQ